MIQKCRLIFLYFKPFYQTSQFHSQIMHIATQTILIFKIHTVEIRSFLTKIMADDEQDFFVRPGYEFEWMLENEDEFEDWWQTEAPFWRPHQQVINRWGAAVEYWSCAHRTAFRHGRRQVFDCPARLRIFFYIINNAPRIVVFTSREHNHPHHPFPWA